ncbi:MAG: hypothetical protein A3D96_03340 [Chlamydiae bacterium RIFCSPHIGHO2_12_FULL_44_59]|nr:MAG: hypothetical protein A2796_05990 [Chlamydiae bacterium RIFCSPHIGHO2_01_FULL_44_39]OGN58557.1 MAG: hypothetical protein A3C42_06490 [Chlamydiae bacterium RIFCSPHIGHO2_02_FULL_45_9]OGN60610.1 MAG: hypothetical protein A3D96_03340 [Chlamydiae bacterium RIFCSPHIGHO2_12_FULL_44_59]OGN66427.1 MAG: hypothetical protein A2978_03855 [Chlamydiae bacterium RIFCSPLOWO2_01_FULL_44_52]OGN69489.1 MAG: hypothetical protein A3I67_04090 [Chlamydiae bacterium RIFCSPLOWO2_02_FULL_45_22]OGN70747.1 MAG: hyp
MRIQEGLNTLASHYEIVRDKYTSLEEMVSNHLLEDGVGPAGLTIYNHYIEADGGYVNVYKYDVHVGLMRVPGKYVGETFVPVGYELGDDISQDPAILAICEEYFPGIKNKLWVDGDTGEVFKALRKSIDFNRCVGIFNKELATLPRPSEIKTSADLDEYNVCSVVHVDGNICELNNGSQWRILQNNLSLGEQVRIVDVNTLKNIRSKNSIQVELIDFPAAEHNVIEKIQHVQYCGEMQFSLILKDGSQWLFEEFQSNVGSWEIGDRVVLVKPSQHFFYSLFNLDRQSYGRLANYGFSASETNPIFVWDKDYTICEK